jgi:hypothetical protein
MIRVENKGVHIIRKFCESVQELTDICRVTVRPGLCTLESIDYLWVCHACLQLQHRQDINATYNTSLTAWVSILRQKPKYLRLEFKHHVFVNGKMIPDTTDTTVPTIPTVAQNVMQRDPVGSEGATDDPQVTIRATEFCNIIMDQSVSCHDMYIHVRPMSITFRTDFDLGRIEHRGTPSSHLRGSGRGTSAPMILKFLKVIQPSLNTFQFIDIHVQPHYTVISSLEWGVQVCFIIHEYTGPQNIEIHTTDTSHI